MFLDFSNAFNTLPRQGLLDKFVTGKKVCVYFGVANAIGGVDVKSAGWDYSPNLFLGFQGFISEKPLKGPLRWKSDGARSGE